jgi:hypothetical protein
MRRRQGGMGWCQQRDQNRQPPGSGPARMPSWLPLPRQQLWLWKWL